MDTLLTWSRWAAMWSGVQPELPTALGLAWPSRNRACKSKVPLSKILKKCQNFGDIIVSTCLWKLFCQKRKLGTFCDTGTRNFLCVHLKNHPLWKRGRRKKKHYGPYIISRNTRIGPFAQSFTCVVQNRHAGEQRTHWDVKNGNSVVVLLPSASLALHQGGFVSHGLAAKGLVGFRTFR